MTCSRGVVIKADCRLAECEQRDWDAVVCPGGMPGATHLKENAALEAILRKQVRYTAVDADYGYQLVWAGRCYMPGYLRGGFYYILV